MKDVCVFLCMSASSVFSFEKKVGVSLMKIINTLNVKIGVFVCLFVCDQANYSTEVCTLQLPTGKSMQKDLTYCTKVTAH